MYGLKSPNSVAVNDTSTRSAHGKVTRNTANIAAARGANENVWSWIDVSV